MRLSLFPQLLIGVILSGCTFNHQNTRIIDNSSWYKTSESTTNQEPAVEKETPKVVPPKVAVGCDKYTPPAIGNPVKADLGALKQASTEKQVREVLLKNIAELNKQINEYDSRMRGHYRAWAKRCAH